MNLPEDTLNEILRHIDDVQTLKYYCTTNKQLQKLCSSRNFWQLKLEQYNLSMPTADLSLSQWFKLYEWMISLDQWLLSNKKSITFYYKGINEDNVMPLVFEYEAYLRSNHNLSINKNKTTHINVERSSDQEYLVSIYDHEDMINGGIFDIDGLIQFLYHVQLLNLAIDY